GSHRDRPTADFVGAGSDRRSAPNHFLALRSFGKPDKPARRLPCGLPSLAASEYNRRSVIGPSRRSRRNRIMPSPFPGIDPYLESQHFWEDFHLSFVPYCRDALNDILPDHYEARLAERLHLVALTEREAKQILPDVTVIKGERKSSRGTASRKQGGG